MLKNNKSIDEIKSEINKNEEVKVLASTGTFEVDADDLPKNITAKKGVSDIYESNDSYIVVNVKDILAPSIKPLDEVKGRVLSDYQNHLEQEWNKTLRAKYNVQVNKKALKRIKKELK